MDVEQRARELLARCLDEWGHPCEAENIREGEDLESYESELRLISQLLFFGMDTADGHVRAALTPPEGHVVVTRNEAGQAVAVTRQDDEGRILSVIAEFEAPEGDMGNPISVPDGFVLVPRYATQEMRSAGNMEMDRVRADPTMTIACVAYYAWEAMLSARPEVKP
ncbi:hypothetical protein [Stenotrophomonas sp. 59]|uniref:hypothetical protein n=1 Tax=Stenotrophomonas sp. 59 TaxID=3051120 RepID=UPI00256F3752|nr:hypothetical protein [Stenotrophomonas sp. 59]